jgi:hypothetical protein
MQWKYMVTIHEFDEIDRLFITSEMTHISHSYFKKNTFHQKRTKRWLFRNTPEDRIKLNKMLKD